MAIMWHVVLLVKASGLASYPNHMTENVEVAGQWTSLEPPGATGRLPISTHQDGSGERGPKEQGPSRWFRTR